jgi:hypothetical protein
MLVADCHAKVLAQQHVVNRHRVFPTGFIPVPVKKVSLKNWEEEKPFVGVRRVGFDSLASCGHNCAYVTPVEG